MRGVHSVCMMVEGRNIRTGLCISNRRVRPSRLKLTKKQIVLIFMFLLFFMGSGIGFVWSNFEKTQRGYALAELKQEEMRLREINRKLRLELAYLTSPKRLEWVARNQLGLSPPSPERIVSLP